jgi:hypothetical protein
MPEINILSNLVRLYVSPCGICGGRNGTFVTAAHSLCDTPDAPSHLLKICGQVRFVCCNMWVCPNGSGFSACDIVWLGDSFSTFRKIMVPSSAGTVIRNVQNRNLLNDTSSYHRATNRTVRASNCLKRQSSAVRTFNRSCVLNALLGCDTESLQL